MPIAFGVALLTSVLWANAVEIGVFFALAAFMGWLFVRRRALVRLLAVNEEGTALLAAGDHEQAAGLFDRLCRDTRSRSPLLHSLAVFNRATTYLERGDPDRAVSLLSAVLHAGWISRRGSLSAYYPYVLGRMALAEALRGRLEAAEAWRSRAHASATAARRGALLLVDAVVEARTGSFGRVAELIEDGWSRAENLLTARQLRAVRVIEAFALEQDKGAEYRAESRASELQRALAAARAAHRGELDWLARNWTELREFLARHGLNGE